jgi:histidinol-phosphate phosphatase family protein
MSMRGADESPGYDIVIPSAGRSSLDALLHALECGRGPLPARVIVVDDRRVTGDAPLAGPATGALGERVEVVRGPGRGPAAARNAGWRAATAAWVAFLDDDVLPEPDWSERLTADLRVGPLVAGSQGRITVPLPSHRPATDWERNVSGLERARWATADMAYRRDVLLAVDGFDERFPRAYREDADLALRITRAGWEIAAGARGVIHPVRPAPASVSVTKQAGNADDVLMRALHGPKWREACGAPPGRRRRHLAITAAAVIAAAAGVSDRRRVCALAGAVWATGTAELARARIAPGPRTAAEMTAMVWTSVLMPFAATGWWLRGLVGLRRRLACTDRAPHASLTAATPPDGVPGAVLFDRDGTLVVDVPYNGDPGLVEPVPTARAALDKLRRAGIPTGVVSNQSGIARGLVSESQLRSVNARIEELLGPLGPWTHCPHGPADDCACRKPRPGLVLEAARRLGVDPRRVAVVGDIGADVDAAHAVGARAILVPTRHTRAEEVDAAPRVAADLESAVDMLLEGRA